MRRRVLQAAAEVFASKGIDAASLDDVATAAGFSRGAVYSNFRGKDDLLVALLSARVADRVREALALVDSADPHADLPTRAAGVLTRHVRDEPGAYLLILEFLTRSARDGRLREQFVVTRREQRAQIAETIRRYAAAEGVELSIPPDTFAVIVLALVNGLAAEYMADPEEVSLDALATAFQSLWPSRTAGPRA